MSAEDLEDYEADVELQLFREYKDVAPMFRYVVETERRFYLANEVHQRVCGDGSRTWVELELRDAWVWDMYRTNRFVAHVKVTTFKDVNVEERQPDTDAALALELDVEIDDRPGRGPHPSEGDGGAR